MKSQSIKVFVNFLFLSGIWMILHMAIIDSNYTRAIPGLRAAIAGAQYGIQGQPAPKLNLANWIDGDGLPIDPIEVNDYRGKVIYLYFFQDW